MCNWTEFYKEADACDSCAKRLINYVKPGPFKSGQRMTGETE